jgi:hypothetical protein
MMPGTAAIAMWCDVDPGARDEFDDWHAHEHQPERLSIPGFLRGSRWVSTDGRNAYFILYEAQDLATVTTGPYLERLNDPTPWSKKMMPNHLNMVRSLCRVEAGFGSGLAGFLLTLRFSATPGAEKRLGGWLASELLPALPVRKGLVAARLLRNAAQAAMTAEQKIRGGDAAADWVVLVNGYRLESLDELLGNELGDASIAREGAMPGAIARTYSLASSLTAAELRRP